MSRYGDPDDRDRPPENLAAWLGAGLRRSEALAWRRWNFSLEQARDWRAAGVTEALTAAQWQVAGVVPATLGGWLAASIASSEAMQWHEFGFSLAQAGEYKKRGVSPEQAFLQPRSSTHAAMVRGASFGTGTMHAPMEKFLNAGVPHTVLGSYIQTQWFDDEAVDWARQGIAAWDARAWQNLGLTPAEASELQNTEVTALQVIRDWWQAGIPFHEVADWLGAGLTAAEAAEQRASGITVEQAAALRALRRGGAL